MNIEKLKERFKGIRTTYVKLIKLSPKLFKMKIDDELYHVYGINGPRFITRLDNYDLKRYIEKVPNGIL